MMYQMVKIMVFEIIDLFIVFEDYSYFHLEFIGLILCFSYAYCMYSFLIIEFQQNVIY